MSRLRLQWEIAAGLPRTLSIRSLIFQAFAPFGTSVVQGSPGALTVAEVAKLLGVSTATVYALCSREELEHFRVLNSIRVLPEKLIVWQREAHRR